MLQRLYMVLSTERKPHTTKESSDLPLEPVILPLNLNCRCLLTAFLFVHIQRQLPYPNDQTFESKPSANDYAFPEGGRFVIGSRLDTTPIHF